MHNFGTNYCTKKSAENHTHTALQPKKVFGMTVRWREHDGTLELA
jgi:hypothetical protein